MNDDLVEKGIRIAKYFTDLYGKERAIVICRRIVSLSVLANMSEDDIKRKGRNWHWSNLYFSGKCSLRDFQMNFQ